jgi:type I restriction enzyme R subunit
VSGFSESTTIQAAIVHRLSQPDIGWELNPPDQLDRENISALIEPNVIAALIRLNPSIAEEPERAHEIMPKLRAIVLSVLDDGLIATNERMINWLRGLEAHQFIGTPQPVPVRLVDFDDPRNNTLIISSEVWFRAGTENRRYDIVLWINGFPVVVGETKTPFEERKSWLNAAKDIHDTYEVSTPGFFAANVLSFATEGKDFRYGPVGLPPDLWQPWGKTDEAVLPLGLARALRSSELLLTPEMVIKMLRTFTLYTTVQIGSATQAVKVLARYPQVEAVQRLVARAKDPDRRQGLIWHHQGSGKTLLMAFACGELRRELPGATVLVVLDRLDLIEQTTREFTSAGVQRVRPAETRDELRRLLSADERGVIITTIFRFKDAGLLNDRGGIVVLVDEAHRTQEGTLGMDMRSALPNATYIGMTGTPISERDRDTFESFGDPADPDSILSAYPPERALADGATLPLRVEAPRTKLQLNKEELDEAFDELTEEEGLSEEEKELLARRASKAKTLFKTDARVRAVCADIVDHYYSRMAPLGLKAQVVAYDRELCVLYLAEIQRLLDERGGADEATIIMTVNDKEDPEEWRVYDRDRAQEARIKARFRDFRDPLKFLIVTAKLLTGFDAPIEGVMYLDKPLRKHTLFQALTRTNRRWTNPDTGQEKTDGLIVDYIGLGKEIARSMRIERRAGEPDPLDVEVLKNKMRTSLDACLERFQGIDLSDMGFPALLAAQDRLATDDDREDFGRSFLRLQALFELLWPDEELREIRSPYRWLAKVYRSIQPTLSPDALLWHRLGAKTLALIDEHIIAVEIRGRGVEQLTVDEEMIDALRKLGLAGVEEDSGGLNATPSAQEILDTIDHRIAAKLAENPHNLTYTSLAERLDTLRRTQIETAEDSIEFLKALLEAARDLVAAERELVEASSEAGSKPQLLSDDHIGALTQIFEEFKPDVTPEIIERVVKEIDAVVTGTRFTDWQHSREGTRTVKTEIRKALNKFGLPATGDLFERAYSYVAERY